MEYISLEHNISALKGGEPITFAHKRTQSDTEQHRLHLNNHLEIYVFVSGETHYVVEDRYYVLERGDILLIPPYSIHVPILKQPCTYERFYLLFPVASLSTYATQVLEDLLHRFGADARLPLTPAQRQQSLELLYRMSALAAHSPSDSNTLQLHALGLELLCLVHAAAQGKQEPSPRAPRLPRLVEEVLAYVSDHCTEITGIAGIASHFYVSEQHLATVFKRHIGVTLNSYLQTKKISVAKRLLEQGHSVTYACYECGYHDCSYFIKVFKRIVGTTPQRYAKDFARG